MSTIFERLAKLNDISPFTWEILTDGYRFTVLCEGGEVHDSKTGIELTNMSLKKCWFWLSVLIIRSQRIEEE